MDKDQEVSNTRKLLMGKFRFTPNDANRTLRLAGRASAMERDCNRITRSWTRYKARELNLLRIMKTECLQALKALVKKHGLKTLIDEESHIWLTALEKEHLQSMYEEWSARQPIECLRTMARYLSTEGNGRAAYLIA